MIKILIIGTGSLKNYGCEAIVRGTYKILKEVMPNCEITVASDNIEYDSQVLPMDIRLVTYKQRFTFRRIYKGILRRFFRIGNGSAVRMNPKIGNSYDIVLACGGDNYCEAPDGGIYYILKDLMLIGHNARKAKKKYCVWGASIGPFNETNECRVFENLREAHLITVREKLAYEYLKRDKGISNHTVLVADPAFPMDYDDSYKLNRSNKEILIGLNYSLLSIGHSVAVPERDEFIKSMYRRFDEFLDKNENVKYILIPHVQCDEGGAQDDFMFMQEYLNITKHKQRVELLPRNLGSTKTKGVVSQLDVLVAARMHCCVAGVSTSVPTLFITYSNKGRGMAEYVYGDTDYTIETADIISAVFSDKLKSLISDRDKIRNYLKINNNRFTEDAKRAGLELTNILGKN